MADTFHLYRDLNRAGFPRQKLRTGVKRQLITRLSRGVYARPQDKELREIAALFSRLPAGAVLGYESAGALHGFSPPIRAGDPVHVIVPAGLARPRISGVICHEAVLAASTVRRDGVPCASPARCAIDIARQRRRFDAIAALDAALRSGSCTATDLTTEVLAHDGLRGVRKARELITIADGRAECAQESHLRLVIIDGGLPPPEPQIWVPDGTGRRVCRLDLGYRERKVGLEYDGRSHLTIARLAADRSRMNWLSARGWTMRYFTARDLYQTPAVVVAEVRSALR